MTSKKISNRKYYLDIMRIIAIYFVIFIHTGKSGSFLFSQYESNSFRFWIYLFIAIFSRFAVPLFFMISGSLLLNKDDLSLKKIYKKILKYGLILLIVSIIYGIRIYINDNEYTIREFIGDMYSHEICSHLWFLYAYIAFLISLPILNKLVKCLDNKDYLYILVIDLIFKTVPLFEYICFNQKITLSSHLIPEWMISDIFIYPLMGYFLENKVRIDNIKTKNICILWTLNIFLIVISCLMTNGFARIDGGFKASKSTIFYDNFAIVNAISMFISVKAMCRKVNMPVNCANFIASLGKNTFIVYLSHMLLMNNKLYELMVGIGINKMISAFIMSLFVMIISYIFSFIYAFIRNRILHFVKNCD